MGRARFLLLFPLLLGLLSACAAQNDPKIIVRSPIKDLWNYPVWRMLTWSSDSAAALLPEYEYLEEVGMYGLRYRSADGTEVSGLEVRPLGGGPHPVVIYCRGGNRKFGKNTIATLALQLAPLARAGYVVLAPQYRETDEFGGRDTLDVNALIELAPDLPGVDGERIGLYSWSRGGMMAFMALRSHPKIRALVAGGAATDLEAVRNERPEMETGVFSEIIPDYAATGTASLRSRSPINWIKELSSDCPILLLHGTADDRVSFGQSERMITVLRASGHKEARLESYEGGGHGLRNYREQVREKTLEWFDRYLK